MELIEITGLFNISYGAPSPIIISDDDSLIIGFNSTFYNNNIVLINFRPVRYYSFGSPNDEAISGHPYYKLGLRAGGFYELKSSDLIEKLQNINKIHPRYSPYLWKDYKHFIITFKENVFECVAKYHYINEQSREILKFAELLLNDYK